MNNGKREDTVLTVNVNVMNCLNLNVTAKIFGHGASMATQLTKDPFTVRLFGDQLFEPKSFAFVYAHNATRSKNRYFKIGQRQTNDTLLKTEKIIVSNTFNNYPQHEIEYIDPNTYITQMDFQFNVSLTWHIYFLHGDFFFPHLVRLSSCNRMTTTEILHRIHWHICSVTINLFLCLFHFTTLVADCNSIPEQFVYPSAQFQCNCL